jgi:aspartate oxidase
MAKASQVDFLVMGAGVAGLRAAIELARHGDVLVITKESLSESKTHYAQGGIAAAIERDADVALHLEDTVNTGDGLVYHPAAEALVREGPSRVAELIKWGAAFDTEAGELLRTREGAHSLARILHANGDATGAKISRALVAYACAAKRVHFAEWTMVTNLIVADGRVVGADLAPAGPLAPNQTPYRIAARAVLIATGGAGQVYSDTTNSSAATGDGVALAAAAGAELADMEFYQFQPTELSPRPAAHYLIGGIRTDLNGRASLDGHTSLPGLYAAGEAACTGAHGANSLIANSLLEALVFGSRAGQAMLDDDLPIVDVEAPETTFIALSDEEEVQLEKQIAELQTAMSSYAGLRRENLFLLEAFAAQAEFADGLKKPVRSGKSTRRLHEALALNRVAHAILHAALARTESRGVHFRKDFPKRDDASFQKHSVYRPGESPAWSPSGKVTFESW